MYVFLIFFAAHALSAETIAEKKTRLENKQERVGVAGGDLKSIQSELIFQKECLKQLQKKAYELFKATGNAPALEELQKEKALVKELEESFRKRAAQSDENEVALWHQPDTSVSDLVIDYGSAEHVYLMPQEIAAIPLSISSNLVVPKTSWDTLLVQVLNETGIGVRTLSPFLRELYFLCEERIHITALLTRPQELGMFAPQEHVGYLFPACHMNGSTFRLVQRLAKAKAIRAEVIEGQVALFGAVQEVEQLLSVVKQFQSSFEGQTYRIIPLHRNETGEMAKVLDTLFSTKRGDISAGPPKRTGTCGVPEESLLTVIPLKKGLFLLGSERTVQEAESTIHKIECSLKQKEEKIVFTYRCRHTSTEELAAVLERVYSLMERTRAGILEENKEQKNNTTVNIQKVEVEDNGWAAPGFYQTGYYQDGEYVVNPEVVAPSADVVAFSENCGKGNFIIDPKTATIVMVVEQGALPKLKELVKKLDVPKKMVQIEALLFEKKVDKETTFGLSLLSIGSKASQTHQTSFTFNDKMAKSFINGITQFCLSRMESASFPAFDIAYKFLLSRGDIQINSNPSVVTLNQTEAVIALTEELSLNMGVYDVETSSGTFVPRDSFTRARYGTTIRVIPTIHEPQEDECWQFGDEGKFITLDTSIDFQTIHPGESPDRPDVTTRHITNIVRIPDGQTVIMGGLRRKNSFDKVDKIPFLGEIPGIGKFFSMTCLKDQSTEMFIFLTPKIISDPYEDFQRQRMIEMTRRPGDIPGFMKRLICAREAERRQLMEGSLEILLDRPSERFYYTPEMLEERECVCY